MAFLAYSIRRAVGALAVFLLVVMLVQFAITRIGMSPPRGGSGPRAIVLAAEDWRRMSAEWANFPATALIFLGLLATSVALRRAFSR